MPRLAGIFFLQIALIAESFIFQQYPKNVKVSFISSSNGDPGTPLFLSPYIESGKIEEAKQLARVSIPGLSDVVSYAGFFTVDKIYNSNLFVWYFPPQGWTTRNNETDPSPYATYVWLQGGPGASSLFGLFEENGPIFVKNNTFTKRNFNYNNSNLKHLIYIDNPVGAGFSFTNDSRGYCTNQTQIGEQLYTALYQFYQMFPDLMHIDLVISGESYGGKYAPALAKTIHDKNMNAKTQEKMAIPLKGLTIGDGWCDPINQLNYADFLYQIGLIDWNQRDEAETLADKVRELINKESWGDATDALTDLMKYLSNNMGHISMYDFVKVMRNNKTIEYSYGDLINTDNVRKAIHVGNLTFDNLNDDVNKYLKEDITKSVAPLISELLENYNILTYSGQQDIIVAYPLTVDFLRHLSWSGSQEYENARRSAFYIYYLDIKTKAQIGFLKQTNNRRLAEAIIRNAGHMAPRDQPIWTTALIMTWYDSITNTGPRHANTETDVIMTTTYL